jgi:DNA (cytosine-5)-methyltransferase 1
MGYHRAGFEVVGVDIRPQPNYPFRFVRGDALQTQFLNVRGEQLTFSDFAAIHASPPCQHYANVTAWRGKQSDHPDLISPIRELLEQTGLPYVIENVPEAPVRHDFLLCGTSQGLRIRRHRAFETNWSGAVDMLPCQHEPDDYAFDHGKKQPESVYRAAMGCDWMTVMESREAIPPAYTEHIGRQLMAHLLF